MNKRLGALLEFYKKDPNDPFVLYGIALEYKAENNFIDADEYFGKLLAVDPGYVAGYLQYAQLMKNENKLGEAKELYRKGIIEAKKSGDYKIAKEMEDFLDELN